LASCAGCMGENSPKRCQDLVDFMLRRCKVVLALFLLF